ncbi:hypothetical protein H0H92_009387, partial [Tricholoma furcatifolium]
EIGEGYPAPARNIPSFSRMIPVEEYLRALVSPQYIEDVLDMKPSNMEGKTLREAFKDACVHFNQFVKAGDATAFTQEGAYLFFTRGAIVQGHNTLAKADIYIPVWLRIKGHAGNPNRWSMTGIFIQVKNRFGNQSNLIDVQKTFKFFTPRSETEPDMRPYITIAMELGVLKFPKHRAAKGSTAKAATAGSTSTPKQSRTQPPMSSPADIQIRDFTAEPKPKTRKAKAKTEAKRHIHPRYEITIRGCSSVVYNVIAPANKASYDKLLGHKPILGEHPRTGHAFQEAILRMKPYWVSSSSYDWAEMKGKNRVGAPVSGVAMDDTDEVDAEDEEETVICVAHSEDDDEEDESNTDESF